MDFGKFTFGSIKIDGEAYEHDVVIDRGRIRKRWREITHPAGVVAWPGCSLVVVLGAPAPHCLVELAPRHKARQRQSSS